MTIWEFMNNNWFLSLIIILCTYWTIKLVFYHLPNRILRHLNIRKHGWPTNKFMDADGDLVYPDPPEKEERVQS